ncbi:MAG: anti-CBASS Acb1 family protein, partial [Pelagibacteraceae bacterium]
AYRVTTLYPSECWNDTPLVFETEDVDDVTEFEEAWDALSSLLDEGESWYKEEEGSSIWSALYEVDCLAGIGRYGCLFLGIDDGKLATEPITGFEDGRKPNDKRNIPFKPEQLKFIRALDETQVSIAFVQTDPSKPRYGLPESYNIQILDYSDQESGLTSEVALTLPSVHWSRVIHITDSGSSRAIFHVPRQRVVLNNIMDIYKILGGSGEMFWRGAFPGISIETNPQLGGKVRVNKTDLKAQMEEYMNGLQRYLALSGMSAKTLSPQISSPRDQIDTQIEAICIQAGCPKRIFLGSERGELASSQDRDTWAFRVRGRQKKVVTPKIIVPFVNRLIQIGILPKPESFKVKWPDEPGETKANEARVAVTRASAMKTYVEADLGKLISKKDFLTRELGYEEEEAEQILKTAEEERQKRQEEHAAQQATQQAAMQSPAVPEMKPGKPQAQAQDAGKMLEVPEPPKGSKPQSPSQELPAEASGASKPVNEPTQNQLEGEDEYGSWLLVGLARYAVTTNSEGLEVIEDRECLELNERGTERELNKPFRMPDGPKKFAVYTKNDKDNVVLVRFGDPEMEIKRDDPERRKNFRARHGCDTDAGPKWKPKYWSCKFWSETSVSDLLENYNPNQPRDSHGRWGGGGGGSIKSGGKQETLFEVSRDADSKKWVGKDGKPAPEHVQKIGIPPAWKNVYVNPDPDGTVMARGVDAKGRVQTKYSDSHTAQASQAKFKRVTELREKREGIFKELESDRKDPKLADNADCLRVVMQTGMRPGGGSDTKADYKSYGATTLEGRHVVANNDGSVTLRLVTGKNKGREVDFQVRDRKTAAMLKERADASGPDGQLFAHTSAESLRVYSQSKDGGGFKTKDHRTALGTETAIAAMKDLEPPKTKKEFKEKVKVVATAVSDALGNTPSVALKSYIDPVVFSAWNQEGLK